MANRSLKKAELARALRSAGRTVKEIAHTLKLSEDMVRKALDFPTPEKDIEIEHADTPASDYRTTAEQMVEGVQNALGQTFKPADKERVTRVLDFLITQAFAEEVKRQREENAKLLLRLCKVLDEREKFRQALQWYAEEDNREFTPERREGRPAKKTLEEEA